jgi:hypothetical protein
MLPFVLMAQLNSEKLSQGYCSLQYFGSPAIVYLAVRSVFLQVFQRLAIQNSSVMVARGGSAQLDFRSGQGSQSPITSAEADMQSMLKTVLQSSRSQKNFVETRDAEYQMGVALPRVKNDDRGCSAVFVARASDTPLRGVLGV